MSVRICGGAAVRQPLVPPYYLPSNSLPLMDDVNFNDLGIIVLRV